MYNVYIKIDEKNSVTDINSSAFVSDVSAWIEIDSGEGDRYRHAQGNYLPKPIVDENGVYRYKYENGKVVERSAEEMAADMPEPVNEPTLEDRIAELEAYNATLEEKITELETYNATLTECVLEMSEYVYS